MQKDFLTLKHRHFNRDSFIRCDACHTCANCHEWKFNASFLGKAKICIDCDALYKCEVCHEKKIKDAFPTLKHKNKQQDTYLRCDSCHTCTVCKEWKWNTSFDQTNSICINCVENLHTCDVCHQQKSKNAFPTLTHKNAQRDGYLRCDNCHTCTVCKDGSGILHLIKPIRYVLTVSKHYTRAMYVTAKKVKMLSQL